MIIDYEAREAMQALRGKLSKRATSSEFNGWMAREICEYIDALRSENEKLKAEIRRHVLHKKWAYEAVTKALAACQDTPSGWLSMDQRLAAFKRRIFDLLDIPCSNLAWRVPTPVSEEPQATPSAQKGSEDA